MSRRTASACLFMLVFAVLAAGCANGPDRLAGISTAGETVTPGVDEAFALALPGKSKPSNPGKWRASVQTLFAGPAHDGHARSVFSFSGLQAKSVTVNLALVGAPASELTLYCDGPFTLTVPGAGVYKSDGGKVDAALKADDEGRTGAAIDVSNSLNTCMAHFRFANSSRAIRLVREENSDAGLLRLDSSYDVCALPPASTLDPLARVFYGDGKLSQTCPFPVGKPELLEHENEAFNAKVKGLLGKPLPDGFIAKGDPGAPIDFSAAPDLQLIYLSTLDYKADFSGMVMARLLRHHAARGVKIRIQVSAVLERRWDAKILEQLASDFPNVSLRKFAYAPKLSLSPDEFLAGTHRVNHIKLFVALARDASKSVAIVGGRNIHDGFLFNRPVNLDSFPHLQHYGPQHALTLNYYANWHDFDVALHDDGAARQMAAHFATIWFQDSQTLASRPFSAAGPQSGKMRSSAARHFISVPFADGHALEAYYVDLIDAAQESIEIVNPYLNPTGPIGLAFDRALARGVRVEIVGRIDMSGDLGGDILTAVNEEFVKKYRNRMEISDYKAQDVLLHAKILMIDQRFVSVSSVNLNNRSFLHDSENGIFVLDRAFYKRIRTVFDYYKSGSRPVDGKMSWSAWKLLLLSATIRHAL